MATGKFTCAPSSGVLPNGIGEDDDVYHPFFNSGSVDLEEGSGDSEECLEASAGVSLGVSGKLRNIKLSSSQDNGSQMSSGKRKRVGVCDMVERKKKRSKLLPPNKLQMQ